MGGALEAGKLVAASWLFHNWETDNLPLKRGLISVIAGLMLLTSIGIFGFLSKSHLDQVQPGDNVTAQIERIEHNVKRERNTITRYEKQLSVLDKAIDKYFELDRVSKGLAAREKQTKTRDGIQAQIELAQGKIESLMDKKFPLEQKIRNLEAEVGPIKYVAELIYGESSPEILGKAVTGVILLIVFIFDPLAVMLIIAGNMSIKHYYEGKPKRRKKRPAKAHALLNVGNPFK